MFLEIPLVNSEISNKIMLNFVLKLLALSMIQPNNTAKLSNSDNVQLWQILCHEYDILNEKIFPDQSYSSY